MSMNSSLLLAKSTSSLMRCSSGLSPMMSVSTPRAAAVGAALV